MLIFFFFLFKTTRHRSSVRLGEWDTNSVEDCEDDICSDPPLDVPVEERIVHENYMPASKLQENDIALLRLSNTVAYTDWIKPICLPTSEHLRTISYQDVAMSVAGWGKTENGKHKKQYMKITNYTLHI